MKVTLFKRIGGIEFEINTSSEHGILHHFLISNYGSMYKQIKLSGMILTRVEPDTEVSHLVIKFVDSDKADIQLAYDRTEETQELYEQMDGETVDYNNSGKFAALEFKGYLLTTVEVDGRTVVTKFPSSMFQNDAIKKTDNFYVGMYIYPEIVGGWYEEGMAAYTYHMQFKQIEKAVMYELHFEDPINSRVYTV